MAKEKAIQLDNEAVREGHVVKVYNKRKRKFTHEAKYYYCIWVERRGKEFPIMLTEFELNRAITRAKRNKEDIPEKSWLTDLTD